MGEGTVCKNLRKIPSFPIYDSKWRGDFSPGQKKETNNKVEISQPITNLKADFEESKTLQCQNRMSLHAPVLDGVVFYCIEKIS
jgi:hypothetical protein